LTEEEKVLLSSLSKKTPDLIEEPNLYLGNRSHARNKDCLKEIGIDIIIQISGEETEPPFPDDFEYVRFVYGDS
jgi:hypothetical protein